MCVTILPHCPKQIADKIPAIIESATRIPSWDNVSDLTSAYTAEPTALPECEAVNSPVSSPATQSSGTTTLLPYGDLSSPGPQIPTPAEIYHKHNPNPSLRTISERFLTSLETPIKPVEALRQQVRKKAPSLPSSPLSPLFISKRRAATNAMPEISPHSSPGTPQPTSQWFYCTRLTSATSPSPTENCNPAAQPHPKLQSLKPVQPTNPAECPDLEIRHKGFHGQTCHKCTDAARRLCGVAAAEERNRVELRNALRNEIRRLEGVVENMRKKLKTLEDKDGEEEAKKRAERKGREKGEIKSEWYGHSGMI